MNNGLLRLYGPTECGPDGYPVAWHYGYGNSPPIPGYEFTVEDEPPIKDLIRSLADYRCVRCHHPYPPGIAEMHPRGEWTPCDEQCMHSAPFRMRETMRGDGSWSEFLESTGLPYVSEAMYDEGPGGQRIKRWEYEARWRILTVHHLDGNKANCRWWNLAPLCQRCHLTIQGRVVMDRAFILEHSEWFKPYAAGFYAWKYMNQDISREQAMERMDELLAMERLG